MTKRLEQMEFEFNNPGNKNYDTKEESKVLYGKPYSFGEKVLIGILKIRKAIRSTQPTWYIVHGC